MIGEPDCRKLLRVDGLFFLYISSNFEFDIAKKISTYQILLAASLKASILVVNM